MLQALLPLGDQLLPVRFVRLADVNGDDSAARRVQVRFEVEDGAVVAEERVFVVESGNQIDRLSFLRLQVLVDDAVFAVGAFPDRDDEVSAIFAGGRLEAPVGVIGPAIDEGVVGLFGADFVIVNLLVLVGVLKLGSHLRFVVAGIVEALAIGRPRRLGELGPLQFVVELLARVDLHDVPGHPVGAGLGAGVGKLFAVVADRPAGERRRAVGLPLVGIKQHPARLVELVLHEEDRLILQAVVTGIEVPATVLDRSAELLVVPQVGQPFADGVALGDGLEIRLGDLVLGFNPGFDLRRLAHVGFEPAVGIGDLGAVQNVGVIGAFGHGVGKRRVGGGDWREDQESRDYCGSYRAANHEGGSFPRRQCSSRRGWYTARAADEPGKAPGTDTLVRVS